MYQHFMAVAAPVTGDPGKSVEDERVEDGSHLEGLWDGTNTLNIHARQAANALVDQSTDKSLMFWELVGTAPS